MAEIDDIVRRLSQVTDELLALYDDDFAARFKLETERDRLRAQAAEFHQRKDEGRTTAELRAELVEWQKQLVQMQDSFVNRATQASSALGAGGAGHRSEQGRHDQQCDEPGARSRFTRSKNPRTRTRTSPPLTPTPPPSGASELAPASKARARDERYAWERNETPQQLVGTVDLCSSDSRSGARRTTLQRTCRREASKPRQNRRDLAEARSLHHFCFNRLERLGLSQPIASKTSCSMTTWRPSASYS